MRVLVAYASALGSTRKIAERIAAGLAEAGHIAEARSVEDALPLGDYDAFVVGSAVHGGKWLRTAAVFMQQRGLELTGKPVWLFSVSSVGDDASFFGPRMSGILRRMRKEPQGVGDYCDLVRARGHHNFAGAIQKGDWGGAGNIFFHVFGGRFGEHTDWEAVDRWAISIAAALHPAPPS